MQFTFDIPEKLIVQAMKLTGIKSKNQLIINALEGQVNRIKRRELIARKGTLDLEIDLNKLRGRK